MPRIRTITLMSAVCVLFAIAFAATASAAPAKKAAPGAQIGAAGMVITQVPLGAHSAKQRTTYVYITSSGTKYHRHYCIDDHRHFKKTLSWVKSHGYHACKVCHPPK